MNWAFVCRYPTSHSRWWDLVAFNNSKEL